MSDAAVLGLGEMGRALALRLRAAGRATTVWNRSAAPVAALVAEGAAAAGTAAEAVGAAPLCIVRLAPGAAAPLLAGPDLPLAGRIVVQAGTSTPAEARAEADALAERGAVRLDAAILASPSGLSAPGARILVSGPAEAFARARATLAPLAAEVRHVGEAAGAASALDLAWLTTLYGAFAATSHAAALCRAEGADPAALSSLLAEGDPARALLEIARARAWEDPTVPLSTWAAALAPLRAQAADAGMDPTLPEAFARLLARAEAQGHGARHVMAQEDSIRRGPGTV